MHVDIDNQQTDLPISLEHICAVVETVLTAENCPCDEVAIHFVSEKEISKLHQQFFNDPSPTDCISFPLPFQKGYRMLGDVFVCPKVALDYASRYRKNPFRELILYTVHGLLHLIGYDDIEDSDRIAMRAAEKRLMRRLQRDNLPSKECT